MENLHAEIAKSNAVRAEMELWRGARSTCGVEMTQRGDASSATSALMRLSADGLGSHWGIHFVLVVHGDS